MRPELTIVQSIQRMVCTGCGAEANASCNCGKPYIPERERAKDAVKADPNKSDRRHAADLGISRRTVQRAREDIGGSAAPLTRVGADGRTYHPHKAEPITVEDDIGPDEYRQAFFLRAADAMSFAVYSGDVDGEIIAAAKRVAAKWEEFTQTLEVRHGNKAT